LGGVYKLAAEEVDGVLYPRIKISENPQKITNPGLKKLYRIYDGQTKKALADMIALADEIIDESKPLTLFDPENTWKTMTVTDYILRPLLIPIFSQGKLVYHSPSLLKIQQYAAQEMDSFWGEYKRLHSPHRYKVDLSKPLYDMKQQLLSMGAKHI